MHKIYFVTLGCPKNQVDSEYMKGLLTGDDFTTVDSPEAADIIIINTCGFVEDAREESVDAIVQAEQYTDKKLIVTGCLSQRYGEQLMEEIPKIDAVLGTGNLQNIGKITKRVLGGEKLNEVGSPGYTFTCQTPRNLSVPHYAYVKIAEGCENNCSYCVIPRLRGKLRSREIEDIYREVKGLVERGVKEIILVAQDTTMYGKDIYGTPSLNDLLVELVNIDKLYWIRILYAYPEHITGDLINVIRRENKICNYLDIPIQHSANKIRRLMKRRGTGDDLCKIITGLRTAVPDIALRTTLIVGFPGETTEDFKDLLDFVREIKFERLGVFKYSREEGTVAANYNNRVSAEIKDRRYNEIMELQREISRQKNEKFIGRTLTAIVDSINNDSIEARTEYDAPEIDNRVVLPAEEAAVGDLIDCIIKEAYEYDLVGEINREFTQ